MTAVAESLLAAGLGFAIGLSLAAPPGPMNAIIAREASRHGAAAGLRVGIAAPIADTIYLVVLWFGLGRFLDGPVVLRVAALLGCLLMLRFAWLTARVHGADGGEAPPRATFWGTFLVSMTNPLQITWWLTAGYILLVREGVWGVGGFLLAVFGWVAVFSKVMAHGASRWSWFTPAVTVLSADLLFLFALLLAWTGLGL